MFETIRNAFKIKDVRNKILWTILFVVIYRLGCYITVPGLQAINIEDGTTSIMGLLNSITGSALSQGTIFSLGIFANPLYKYKKYSKIENKAHR